MGSTLYFASFPSFITCIRIGLRSNAGMILNNLRIIKWVQRYTKNPELPNNSGVFWIKFLNFSQNVVENKHQQYVF